MTDRRDEFINAIVDFDELKCINILKKRIADDEDLENIIEDIRKATGIVGKRFEDGDYLVSDLMMAGEVLSQIMEVLNPVLSVRREKIIGTVVIGTVEGDVHDIGKSIVIALLETEGFRVIDLGVNQPPESYINAIREYHPDIVALSGLLTEASESMKNIINEIKKAGLRDKVKIVVGGGRTDEETMKYTGADEWSYDATSGVGKFKRLLDKKQV
ncbi:methylmalonyl-CoA mutase cobalamin-binding domain/chain [Methanomicrobium sp. W14]|uniref:cobalamin B12-binding domain-containing protein n=1 Tax=Methanomicrobium sp. W14 TaxID=2817839 RepID=UPI001AE6DBE4|nr:cobalamin-dependent protein [Methanomicrobium sp. W14]MBP2134219.1 methylmalonyl-CoA mutase cobalamin-binding domain/chain [Methanomicrobium sp. W14]